MAGDSLQKDLAEVLNYWSAENDSNTPDFILAKYLLVCLAAFNECSRARETWYGQSLSIGGGKSATVDAGCGPSPLEKGII